MERLLLDTTWLQEAIYPFLGAGDLLELGQVNRHFRNDTEDYFDQYQHGRKEGYFHHSCQMICFHDPLILVGLLLDEETYPVFFLQQNKEMLKFLDEWPNDHTATVPMLDQIRATSWRKVCLRLLDRIRAIEERKNTVLEVESKIPSEVVSETKNERRRKNYLFHKSHKPTISAYFVMGSWFPLIFQYLCSEKGLADTDVLPGPPQLISPYFFRRATLPVEITPPAPKDNPIDVQCNVVAALYGPAGGSQQVFSGSVRELVAKNRGFSRCFNPDFLVWGLCACSGMESRTPYGYKSDWQANRSALMDFVLARGCSCKVLLVLVQQHEYSPPVSAEEVDKQLGLSCLSKFGIQWRIQICHLRYEAGEPSKTMLQGGAQGFEWAVSQFV